MRYLTVAEVFLIHEHDLQRYGGSSGLRSIALLESAVFRPQTSYGGEELYETIFEKTASMIHAIISNHPFIDGNKRTAMVSGAVFLNLNGYSLELTQEKFVEVAMAVASKKMLLKDLAVSIEENSVLVPYTMRT